MSVFSSKIVIHSTTRLPKPCPITKTTLKMMYLVCALVCSVLGTHYATYIVSSQRSVRAQRTYFIKALPILSRRLADEEPMEKEEFAYVMSSRHIACT